MLRCSSAMRKALCYAKGAFRTRRANGVQSECLPLWPQYTVAELLQRCCACSIVAPAYIYTLCI